MSEIREPVVASVLGTAVGDALGLPFEGLPKRRVARMLGAGPLGHHFLLGRGMVSDDTEQSVFVVQSLFECQGDVDRFQRSLARRLRIWVLLVPAGIGLATLKACGRLLVGVSPSRSGVPSAGNGAAMRSAVIGAWFGADLENLRRFTEASCRVTHTHPLAIEGALAVARAAAAASLGEDIGAAARAEFKAPEWQKPPSSERGVSGFVVATVLAALGCVESHAGDFRGAVEDAVRRGGDTDTLAAIVGGIVAAGTGREGIPAEWRAGIVEFPRSVAWMETLGPYSWWLLPIRNLVFLWVVLLHGFRRLLPPY